MSAPDFTVSKTFRYQLWLILLPALLFSQTAPDTLQRQPAKQSDLEGPVQYWADVILMNDDGNEIYLSGNAKFIYQNMMLEAANIRLNQDEKMLYAEGLPDTVLPDGTQLYRNIPKFSETGEKPMYGNFIEYNFETKRGRIQTGKTEMDPGYYKGQRIHKIADKTLLVKTGYFTSCEYIDQPHFYFKSDQMRVQMNDKVVAKPITFYIADIPLAVLPFGIFPNKTGRQSGILIPKYGESRIGGRFLRGIGYYWAPSDYYDATFSADFYDRLGFSYNGEMRYTVRYLLNGSVNGQYFPRDPSTGRRNEQWRTSFSHNQNIGQTISVSGSGSFVSSKNFIKNSSSDPEDRLQQNLTSNLSIRKSFKKSKNSLSLNFNRVQNLQSGQVDYTAPSISFSRPNSSIYETLSGKKVGSERAWYKNIYFSYNSNLLNRGSRTPVTTVDSNKVEHTDFTAIQKAGIQHNFSFTSSQKVLKYINLSPNVSYREDWFNEVSDYELNDSSGVIESRQKKQFAARRTFNTSLGIRTTLYGLFEPNIGALKYIRHKMDPSLSFTYSPDFSDPFYGYFQNIADSTGVVQKKDRFAKSVFGGTPGRSSSRQMNVQLGNVFQGKLIDADGKETKIDLLTATFSTQHNFLADSLKWSNLNTSLRTSIFGNALQVSTSHSFYALNENNKTINRLLPAEGKWPRLLNLTTSFGFRLNNKNLEKFLFPEKTEVPGQPAASLPEAGDEGILTAQRQLSERTDLKESTKKINQPWSLSFNFNYSLNAANPEKRVERFGLNSSANFQLSKNWKINWNARFDLREKELTSQYFSIYRDLHCWEMSFNWQPTVQYYSFQINIKSSMLQDIKYTKHPSGSTYLRDY